MIANELYGKSTPDLLDVVTSKNYGRSTRTLARKILEERGIPIDNVEFANPTAADRVREPLSESTWRLIGRFVILGLVLLIGALMRWCSP